MRVLSGIQPSGQLHLGNYFGSIQPNLEMTRTADESFFFVADLHALTTVQDREVLERARREIVLDYLACGFDPDQSALYYQSDIPEHTQLMWVLLTVTPMGLLERAVSYKEKVQQGITASSGLFTYPVLMAADILLYKADIVPVGKDQKQHVEMARDIAVKFNNAFKKEILKLPEPHIRAEVAVVPGTDGRKMSKSYVNTIPLFGPEKEIERAIMSIVTDSKDVKESKDPADSTIYNIHRLFLEKKEADVLAKRYQAGGLGYGEAKKMLLSAFLDHFAAMRRKREELKKKPAYLQEVMREGAKKARKVASATLREVMEAVGIA